MSNQKTNKTNIENNLKEQFDELKESVKSPSLTFYGSKLFVKCFAWFIFITLINIFLAAFYGYFYYLKPTENEFNRVTAKILEDNGRLMVETYEKEGSLKLTKFKEPGNIWLYDENFNILFDGQKKNNISTLDEMPDIPLPNGRNDNYFNPPPPPPPHKQIFNNNRLLDFQPPPKPDHNYQLKRIKNLKFKEKSQDFIDLKRKCLAFYKNNKGKID